jgi:iron(III) transport system permease protein
MSVQASAAGGADARATVGALLVAVALLAVLPPARLALEAVAPGGALSLEPALRALSAPAVRTATWNTLVTGIGGTLIAVGLGTAVALVVALTDLRGRGALVFCFVTPLMLAPQVTALAWLQVTGPSSPLLKAVGIAPPLGAKNPLYSAWGVALLLGLQYAPLVFLALRAALRALPRELIEAASVAGAPRLGVVRDVVLPLMRPALAAAAALAFVSCVGNFGIGAFLGIPGNVLLLPTLIYQRLTGLGPGALAEVAALSLLVGLIAGLGVLAQELALRRTDVRLAGASRPAAAFPLGRWRPFVEGALWLLVIATLVLPLLGLAMTSLVPAYGVPLNARTATLGNYAYVLLEHEAARRALVNSLGLATAASIGVVVIGVPLAYFAAGRGGSGRLSGLLRLAARAAELPYALPGVVLALACILVFIRPLPGLGWSLYGTLWIILFAYLSRFLVLALRPIASGYAQVDPALEEAARAAGAGFGRRLVDVLAPLVAPAAAAGGLLVFLTAFNELTVSALLWASGTETLGVVVFSFEQGGDSNVAAALASLTVLLTVVLMLATLAFARYLPRGVLPWRD